VIRDDFCKKGGSGTGLRFKKSSRSARRGFSLLETIIVLTIVSSVISGLWLVFSTIRMKRQAAETVQGMLFIASKLRETYGGTIPKTGESVAYNAYVAHWMPENWGYNAALDDIVTPMGPAYLVLASPTWEQDFVIGFEGMTESQCNAMVIALKSIISTNPQNFVQIDTASDSWYDSTNGFIVNVPSCAGVAAKDLAPSMIIYMKI